MHTEIMKLLFSLFTLSALLVFSVIGTSFASSTYDVNIPTGASSPDAPYFWQSEKDGGTNGVVEINVGDEIVWKNADTAAHTVSSGTPAEGSNGIFDSGLFGPGKSFHFTFTEKGHYPYFCVVHPWMVGTIIVTEGYSILPNVGKDVGDGMTTFNVEYDFNRLLSSASINKDQKSITFQITGNAKSDDNNLTLLLPSQLLDGPFVIWADGKKTNDFESVKDNDVNIVDVELTKDTKQLTIIGTSVVPEFGLMAMSIFGIGILSVVLFSHRFSLSNRL